MIAALGLGARSPAALAEGAPEPPKAGRVKLVYTVAGKARCDGEAMFRKLVAGEMNGRDPFVLEGEGEPAHVLDVHIQNDSPGYRVTASMHDERGKLLLNREFVERTCADAVDRAVVEVLLLVFPPQQATPHPRPHDPLFDPPPEAPPDRSHGGAPDAKSEEVNRLNGEIATLKARVDGLTKALEAKGKRTGPMDLTYVVSAGALMTVNLTSNVGPGVWMGFEGRSGPISVGIDARVLLPSPVNIGPHSLDLSQISGFLVPCGRYWYVFGCATVGGGVELDTDTAYDPPTSTFGLFQIGARAGVEVPFGSTPLGARAWGEFLVTEPGTRQNYPATGDSWQRPYVSGFFGAALLFKFGAEESG